MTEPFFEFEWPVPPDFTWIEWLDENCKPVRPSAFELQVNTSETIEMKRGKERGPILMAGEGKHTSSRPMDRENATLFRRFAKLDPMDLNALREFARRYGWLGVERLHQARRLRDGSQHWADGEPYLVWIQEIEKMREAIWLWEHPKSAEDEQKKWFWLLDTHLQRVQGRMKAGKDSTPQLRIAPMTLLAAMWLQLALAIAGGKSYAKCKFCKKEIEISKAQSGFRADREFCSHSCKTKDYRKRKREAMRLATMGVSVAKIAKKLATNPATIRAWLLRRTESAPHTRKDR